MKLPNWMTKDIRVKDLLPYALAYGFAGFFFIGGWLFIGGMIYQGLSLEKYIFPKNYWAKQVSEHENSIKEYEQQLLKAVADIKLSQLQEAIVATDEFKAKETLERALSGVSPEQQAKQEQILRMMELRLKVVNAKAQIQYIQKIERQIQEAKQSLEDARRKLRESQ